jgi:hypothetical protein
MDFHYGIATADCGAEPTDVPLAQFEGKCDAFKNNVYDPL